MFPFCVCTLRVHCVYIACTLRVHCVYIACTLRVHCVYIACTLRVHCVYAMYFTLLTHYSDDRERLCGSYDRALPHIPHTALVA